MGGGGAEVIFVPKDVHPMPSQDTLFSFFNVYLFIWLHWVLVVACGI